MERADYLVIGSGIAGLSFAIKAAETGSVIVLTKRARTEANTRYAQGGIAAVWSPQDSFEAHEVDTHTAGDGLCDERAVSITVREGPARVRELIEMGVAFSRRENGGDYDLGREGGHSARRVLHAGDITGSAIQRALVATASEHDNITIYDDLIGVDLITANSRRGLPKGQDGDRVLGVYALNCCAVTKPASTSGSPPAACIRAQPVCNRACNNADGEVRALLGKVVVLATGGLGKVYLYTSNPDVATGDGHAMALRAGAKMANMEFVQFHPTCLFHPKAKNFLISEALRGEGGTLLRRDGTSFMEDHHELGSLAPRDIVARAIDHQLKATGDDCVFLDMTHHRRDYIEKRFPNIHARCLHFGVDMVEEPIPVVPAAHYACGGVQTDEHGRTSLDGLYAIGEVACTGLHGANRLASNSLLEAVVFAHRAFVHAREHIAGELEPGSVPEWNAQMARDPEEMVIVAHNWGEIRRFMWDYVGIVRTNKRLRRARNRVDFLLREIHQYYWNFRITRDLIELRNIAACAKLIIESALLRRESRGLHFNLDYPEHDEVLRRPTVLSRRDLGW